MVQLLLTDGTGPLFAPLEEGELRRRVEEIVDALDGWEETW